MPARSPEEVIAEHHGKVTKLDIRNICSLVPVPKQTNSDLNQITY